MGLRRMTGAFAATEATATGSIGIAAAPAEAAPPPGGASTAAAGRMADSKAIDVALGLGWGRRLPQLRTGAIDPG